jgi:hypothetical protein
MPANERGKRRFVALRSKAMQQFSIRPRGVRVLGGQPANVPENCRRLIACHDAALGMTCFLLPFNKASRKAIGSLFSPEW